MTKRKALVILSALVFAAFAVLATRMRPVVNQKNEMSPVAAPMLMPEKDTFRATKAWLVVRNMTVERTETWSLSREETKVLVELAMDEVGNYGYDRNAPIQVEEERRFFTVTFPEPPHPGPPELICCADFAIKVRFDKTTRLVTEVECGG